MDSRRMTVAAILAGSAALAAAIMRFAQPFPIDAATLEAVFADAARDAPEEAVALSTFAPRVCFLDRADRLPDDLRARARMEDADPSPAGAALVALFEAGGVRLLAPERGRLTWDGAEHGEAFCALAAYASRSTSGGLVLYRFEGVTTFAGAGAPGGAHATAKEGTNPAGEGLHIRAE